MDHPNPETTPSELGRSVDLAAVEAAHERIAGLVERTPLFEVPASDLPDGVRLFLKLECRQVSGAFKARGANHFIARLTDGDGPAGVITYSSGNHGRAVAEAARNAGLPALVVVPDHIDPSKEANIRAAGAEVLHAGGTSLSRREAAEREAEARGWLIIPPFDHPWIVAGQGTVALEILDEHPDPVGVWAPVGGGGLAAGVATVLRERSPKTRFHTVEPTAAACFAHAYAARARIAIDRSDSVADGLLPLQVGALNWAILSTMGEWTSPTIAHTVDDAAITRNFRRLVQDYGLDVEPSAAVSSAPFFEPGADAITPGLHVAIVSGGNVSDERRARLLAGE